MAFWNLTLTSSKTETLRLTETALTSGHSPLEGLGVLVGEVLPAALLLGQLAHLDRVELVDDDQVRAGRLELLEEGGVEPLDDRDHPDDGHDPDHDPEQGQEGAELVGLQGVEGHGQDLAEDAVAEGHCSDLRASTGLSLAALLAG